MKLGIAIRKVMNFLKNLRDIGRNQTKPSSTIADSQNNLIDNNFTDSQHENVLSSQSNRKSEDKTPSCQPKVGGRCSDRHQPAVRAQAPITGGVRAPVPDLQPENVLTSQSSLKSKDKATSCHPKVKTVCGDRHQPVVRAQAPITGGVRAPVETGPELLASWEEIEELEDDVRALKAALRAKDNEMKKICVEYDAKIEKIQSDCFNPVPISPCVPMPAPTSSHCNTKADNMRNKQLLQTLTDKLATSQSRCQALQGATSKLGQKLERSETRVAALQVGEDKAQQLCRQQQDLIKSLLAQVQLKKKTKFIQGSRKLQNHRTAPTKPVMAEINKASARLYEEQRQKQKTDIERLISIVDNVSINYSVSADRYSNKSIIIKNHVVQLEEDICVTKLFKAICLFADETTDQENEEYDAFLQEELKPPIIYLPELLRPRILWNQLN